MFRRKQRKNSGRGRARVAAARAPVFASLLLSCGLAAGAEGEPAAPDREKVVQVELNRPLVCTVGESLVYQIKWAGIPAGLATLEVKWIEKIEGAEVYRISLKTRSNRFFDFFYRVRTDVDTFVDVKAGYSRLFRMDKNEGRVHQKEKISFDYERGVAVYIKDLPGPYMRKSTREVRVSEYTADPLSCFYTMRSLDLEPGKVYRIPVQTYRRSWLLMVRVLRLEEVSVPCVGRRTALKIRPEAVFPGVFVRKGAMTLWLDEKTHVPLLLKVDIPIGSVSAALVKADNCPLAPEGGK